MRHFGTDPQFWQHLLPRAGELQLSCPLYYASRYTKRVLHTPIPEGIIEASQKFRPPWGILKSWIDLLLAHIIHG